MSWWSCFGGTQIVERLGSLQYSVEGLAIDWLSVPAASIRVGKTLGSSEMRTRTGVSIVAVLRGEVTFPSPEPDFVFEADRRRGCRRHSRRNSRRNRDLARELAGDTRRRHLGRVGADRTGSCDRGSRDPGADRGEDRLLADSALPSRRDRFGAVAEPSVSESFIELGAQIGVILLLFMLGLEYTGSELTASLRTGFRSGVLDGVLNFTPGLLVGWLLGWGWLAAVLLGRRHLHLILGRGCKGAH